MNVLLDRRFMRLALREARKGLGSTSPNPAVGALIVRNGQILARGFHRRAGSPHAEVEALHALPGPAAAAGATVYVTLEPCSTYGRTPPCTDALIGARVARVVVGCIDLNPRHRGQGLEQLRLHGIEVSAGILEVECTALNVGFNRWITTGRPWVIVKYAQSLDGRLTRPPGESTWLTGKRARFKVQRLRRTVDAILIGAETLRRDDPKLTVRVGSPRNPQPWRVVVTRSGNLPAEARLFTDDFRERTLIYRQQPWQTLLEDLGHRGVTRLLVEGGSQVLGSLRDEGWIDEVWAFFAPWLTGGPVCSVAGTGVSANDAADELEDVSFQKLGADLLVRGTIKKPAR